MRVYRYDPADHAIRRHEQGASPLVIAIAPHVTSPHWRQGAANTVLLDACGPRVAAQFWPQFAVDFHDRLNPLAHWKITMGDGEHMAEIDTWLAVQRGRMKNKSIRKIFGERTDAPMKAFIVRDAYDPDQYHLYDQDPTTKRICYRCPMPVEVLENSLPDAQLTAILRHDWAAGPAEIDMCADIIGGPLLDTLAAVKRERTTAAERDKNEPLCNFAPRNSLNMAEFANVLLAGPLPDIPLIRPINRRAAELDPAAWKITEGNDGK